MATTWNPDQYSRFSDDRGRPFFDLVARIRSPDPRRVVDLGCGPGNLTAALAQCWSGAHVHGIDSSAEMITTALTRAAGERLTFERSDIRSFAPSPDVDVLVSNAALQWVPEHLELLRQWTDALASGAWMAWQVPGNFDADSHRLLFELARSPCWAPRLSGVQQLGRPVLSADEYLVLLLEAGWSADVWETTYHHVLPGPDAVLEWVRGTTLGPIRGGLSAREFAEFEHDYAALLRAAYPAQSWGTIYPFRRIFAVGHKP